MIFGILSSGNLCQRNWLLFQSLHTASPASYLKDIEIKGYFWWFNQDKLFTFFILKWHLKMMNDQLQDFQWHQPSFDSKILDLTSKAILRSSEAVSENVIKWLNLLLLLPWYPKLAKISLNGPKTSLTSEADMEAVEVEFRKWLHFQANAWNSSWKLFAYLILSNLRVHGLK